MPSYLLCLHNTHLQFLNDCSVFIPVKIKLTQFETNVVGCTLSCWDKNPYPPHYRMAFASSTIPYPHLIGTPCGCLLSFQKEEYGLTTFPIDNLSDDLGSASCLLYTSDAADDLLCVDL